MSDGTWTQGKIEEWANALGVDAPPRYVYPRPDKTPEREAYSGAVHSAYRRPVISLQAAADMLMPKSASPEDRQAYATALKSYYGPAMSPQQFAREVEVQQVLNVWRTRAELTGQQMPSQFVEKWVGSMRTYQKPTKNDLAILDVLSGYDIDKRTPQYAMAQKLRAVVAQHAPKGKYANFGARSQAEQAELEQAFGQDANYILTDEGRQTHEALRVTELLNAVDDNYDPASGFSQAARLIGGFAGPLVDMVRNVTTEPGVYDPRRTGEAWDEFGMLQKPDGKFQHAALLWQRGEDERGTTADNNAYTADGQAKYASYDPTTMAGLANVTQQNTSFPVARGYNNLAPVREVAMHIGNALGGGDNMIPALRAMRDSGNRMAPVLPEGMDPKEFEEQTRSLQKADSSMDGWHSAYYGPKFADAWNATMGRVGFEEAERTYLSPFGNMVFSLPGEVAGEPINLAANLLTGPVFGAVAGAAMSGAKGAATSGVRSAIGQAAKGAARGLGRGTLTGVRQYWDDAIDETIEDGLLTGPALTGPSDYFAPEETNMMMGGKNPNDEDYDDKQEAATQDALARRRAAVDAYNKSRPKPKDGPELSGPRYGGRHPL